MRLCQVAYRRRVRLRELFSTPSACESGRSTGVGCDFLTIPQPGGFGRPTIRLRYCRARVEGYPILLCLLNSPQNTRFCAERFTTLKSAVLTSGGNAGDASSKTTLSYQRYRREELYACALLSALRPLVGARSSIIVVGISGNSSFSVVKKREYGLLV